VVETDQTKTIPKVVIKSAILMTPNSNANDELHKVESLLLKLTRTKSKEGPASTFRMQPDQVYLPEPLPVVVEPVSEDEKVCKEECHVIEATNV
jgi:hypothetical protein